MVYDPSGDTRLEGEELIKRIAQSLNVEVQDLKDALIHVASLNKTFRGNSK